MRVQATARGLVEAVRSRSNGGLDASLQEYGLSTQEGVALMCIAEALIRIPDDDSQEALTRDKILAANWDRRLGASDSAFVNASSWALMLTGRFVGADRASSGRGKSQRAPFDAEKWWGSRRLKHTTYRLRVDDDSCESQKKAETYCAASGAAHDAQRATLHKQRNAMRTLHQRDLRRPHGPCHDLIHSAAHTEGSIKPCQLSAPSPRGQVIETELLIAPPPQ